MVVDPDEVVFEELELDLVCSSLEFGSAACERNLRKLKDAKSVSNSTDFETAFLFLPHDDDLFH